MTDLFPPAKATLSSLTQKMNKNDFKQLTTLGEGTFGKVFKVNHIPTGKECRRPGSIGLLHVYQIENEILIMLVNGQI